MWEGRTRTMSETTTLLRYGFYGKRNRENGTWEVEPPDCATLIDHSIKCADRAVVRDAILNGTIANFEDVPAQYKVSKESGLEEWEDDEMRLLDADME